MLALRKRILAIAAAAVLVVTTVFTAGMFPEAVSAADDYMVTNQYGADGNGGLSPEELSEATLLVGDGNELKASDNSAATTIKNAENTYFLGIASQFCVFLSGNFIPTAADCEGRVAIGGNLDATSVGYN